MNKQTDMSKLIDDINQIISTIETHQNTINFCNSTINSCQMIIENSESVLATQRRMLQIKKKEFNNEQLRLFQGLYPIIKWNIFMSNYINKKSAIINSGMNDHLSHIYNMYRRLSRQEIQNICEFALKYEMIPELKLDIENETISEIKNFRIKNNFSSNFMIEFDQLKRNNLYFYHNNNEIIIYLERFPHQNIRDKFIIVHQILNNNWQYLISEEIYSEIQEYVNKFEDI